MVPRKRSVAIDYPAKLGKFISTQYSPAEAAHHNEGVKALGEQRAQCLHASDPGESNRDIGMRYWAQLSLLDNRIDFNQVGMRFEWYDAFKGPTALAPSQGKCASISLNLEIASVLFNTAVLYLHAGSKEHQVGTSESFKNALGFFKKAAGMFAAVKDTASKIDGAVSKDLSADCLTMLETLSLAHAQRCFLEQAAASKKSPAILAKLAGGCANLYAEAHGPTASGGELAKHLKGTTLGAETELEALYFRASSHIYAAQAVEAEHKGLKKGHEVGHMVAAVQKLDAALTLAKKVKPDRKDGVAAFLATATKALAQSRSENNTVYHMLEEANISDPEGKVLVKPEPVPSPLDTVGSDRFGSLVPESVRRSAVAYASQRQDYVNRMVMDMQQNTEAVRARLLPITPQLEACDTTEPGVPVRLREKLPDIQSQGAGRGLAEKYNVSIGMRDEASESLAMAKESIESEERADDELRRKFGSKWTRSLSSSINAPIRKDLDSIAKQMSQAKTADDTVADKLEKNKKLFDMLDRSVDDLDALVAGKSDPTQAVQDQTSVEKAQAMVQQLKAIVYQIERLLAERDAIRTTSIRHKDSEDGVRALSAYILQGSTAEAAFKALLGQYSAYRDKFVANHQAVEAALIKLEEGNASFIAMRSASAEVSRRESAIKDISMAIDAFAEISAYVREGQNWYSAIQEKIGRVQTRAEDFKVARDIQKEDLIESIAEASAREPPPPQAAATFVAAPAAPVATAFRSTAPDTSRDEEFARQLAGLSAGPPAQKSPPPPAPAPAPAPAPTPVSAPVTQRRGKTTTESSRLARCFAGGARGEGVAWCVAAGACIPWPLCETSNAGCPWCMKCPMPAALVTNPCCPDACGCTRASADTCCVGSAWALDTCGCVGCAWGECAWGEAPPTGHAARGAAVGTPTGRNVSTAPPGGVDASV